MSPAFTDAGLRAFDDVAASHVGDGRVPGLVTLIASGDHVHVQALGRLTVGGAPVQRDTPFRIASTTKPITAAVVLALVRDGLLDLDAPVDSLLPELADRRVLRRPDGPLDDTVPATRPITARDLLTFTFGFGMVMEMFMSPTPWPVVAAADERRLGTIGPPDPDTPPPADEWIAGLGSLPLLAQPGERWLYNTGTQVLTVLAARAAGQPYDELLRSRVTEPLGMSSTAFWTADASRLPTAYMPTPDGLVVRDPPDGAWSRPPRFHDGSAGLLSTVDDLLAFARMLLADGDPVLTPELVRQMTSSQLTAEQLARGGFGPGFFDQRTWGLGQAVYADGSFGWDGGFGASWRVDPPRDLVTIVLTQRMWETSEPSAVHRDLLAASRAALA